MFKDLIKENDFIQKKASGRQYPTKTIMDSDNTDDLVLLVYTRLIAKSQLHSL